MGLLDRIKAAQSSDATPAADTASIDLTSEAPARPRQEWGRPGRCPECDGRGYLDHVDLIDRIMYQHCIECRHQWTVTEAELAAQA